ncbi:MAG TPA: GntR family transcriptional regulator [bacterium]|nr:GntR family transcriptional regulator [bacterium]
MTFSNANLNFGRPVPLVKQIYHSLAEAIAKGDLPPGQLLKEVDLQQAFGVSRAPIREAIRLLEAEGLVVVDAYKKKYVRNITYRYIQNLIPVLSSLEGCAANLAAKRMGREEIDHLWKLNQEMETERARENYDQCVSLNLEMNKIYIEAADNETLAGTIETLKKPILLLWVTESTASHSEIIPEEIREHSVIIRAFESRDDKTAEELVRTHIRSMLERLLRISSFDSEGFYQKPGPENEFTPNKDRKSPAEK